MAGLQKSIHPKPKRESNVPNCQAGNQFKAIIQQHISRYFHISLGARRLILLFASNNSYHDRRLERPFVNFLLPKIPHTTHDIDLHHPGNNVQRVMLPLHSQCQSGRTKRWSQNMSNKFWDVSAECCVFPLPLLQSWWRSFSKSQAVLTWRKSCDKSFFFQSEMEWSWWVCMLLAMFGPESLV